MCMYLDIKILNISVCKKPCIPTSPIFFGGSFSSSYKSCLVIPPDVSFCFYDFTGGNTFFRTHWLSQARNALGFPKAVCERSRSTQPRLTAIYTMTTNMFCCIFAFIAVKISPATPYPSPQQQGQVLQEQQQQQQEITNFEGLSPLFLAAANGHLEVVKLLLQHGGNNSSDVNERNGASELVNPN